MGRGDASKSVVLLMAAAALVTCSDEAPARAQLLIVLDTNAPVVGQLAGDAALSVDAAIDTVRIDIIDDVGQPYDFRDFVAPDARDWPLSFGVAAGDFEGRTLRFRIRAFRGALVTPGSLRDVTTVEPHPEVTIDRLVSLSLPSEGVRTVGILLDADCIGVPVKFTVPQTTCVSRETSRGDPHAGIATLEAPPPTRAGTWDRAREVPCSAAGSDGRVCVPGGYSVLGDLGLEGLSDNLLLDSVPLRPVYLEPYWMDVTEMTVGRYRALAAQGGLQGEPPQFPIPSDTTRAGCTWLGVDVATNDNLPLTCINWASAREVCERFGGALPSEAQWEHASRGRGQQRDFPWGDDEPTCCAAALSRLWDPAVSHECPDVGVPPVGSYAGREGCSSADVSRDGILDMAGSVSEHVADFFLPYDHPCWAGEGVLHNPVCDVEGETNVRSARGGDWTSGLLTSLSALRGSALQSQAQGFRCVYPDAPGGP